MQRSTNMRRRTDMTPKSFSRIAALVLIGLVPVTAPVQAKRLSTVDAFLRQWDADRDGTLSLDEVKKAATARFNALDRDHDGTLDRRELGATVTAWQFKQADLDKIGRWSRTSIWHWSRSFSEPPIRITTARLTGRNSTAGLGGFCGCSGQDRGRYSRPPRWRDHLRRRSQIVRARRPLGSLGVLTHLDRALDSFAIRAHHARDRAAAARRPGLHFNFITGPF